MERLLTAAMSLTLIFGIGCTVHTDADEGTDVSDVEVSPPADTNDQEDPADTTTATTLYYFIAIHNEPIHGESNSSARLAESYEVLQEMIRRADSYNIRLTLMFTAQWVELYVGNAERQAELQRWRERGHEIAAHHHSIYHGNWDGYTNFSKAEAEAQRIAKGKTPEPYLGTMSDYMTTLRELAPDIRSGCVNDESDKRVMPDEIIYDTCAGLANFGEPGRRVNDGVDPNKGQNEYVSVGTVGGIERRWLTHYQICNERQAAGAPSAFEAMNGGVYGVVTHSAINQAPQLYEFMAYLHGKDPTGKRSRTVRDVIEQRLLPEVMVTTEQLEAKDSQSPCGDGVCGALEQKNPNLCPSDCTQ